MQVFETKLRKVGSSWGALIPHEVVKQEKIGEGEKIQLAVIKKDLSLLEKAFGSVKPPRHFKRDHKDRVF